MPRTLPFQEWGISDYEIHEKMDRGDAFLFHYFSPHKSNVSQVIGPNFEWHQDK